MVYGIGINDAGYNVNPRGGKMCPYYTRWMSMIQRCYDKGALSRDTKYAGVTVCDDWLTFSKFKAWMQQQDWKGKELDKDLLGGKIYSPETCLFISPALNKFLTSGRSKIGGLVGTSYEADRGKWKASIKAPGGRRITLGRFDTELEAHKEYLANKAIYLLEFCDTKDMALLSAITKAVSSMLWTICHAE